MPPKKAESGKDGKPVKKTKKQLEEEARVAAEQARVAAEIAKAVSEPGRENDLVSSQIRADAAKQLLSEEGLRLSVESAALEKRKLHRQRLLQQVTKAADENSEWLDFLNCDAYTPPIRQATLAQYMASLTELPLAPKAATDIHSIFAAVTARLENLALAVRALRRVQGIALEAADRAKERWLEEEILQLRSLATQLLDSATVEFLAKVDSLEANARQEVQLVEAAPPHFTFAFWGTLQGAKGFRAKVIDQISKSGNVNLEIPKSLGTHCVGNLFGIRTLTLPFSDLPERADSLASVGGLLRLEAVAIPPLPKSVGTWKIGASEAAQGGLQKLPYPNQESVNSGAAWQAVKVDWKLAGGFELPPGNIVPEISVSLWSEGKWTQEGISDVRPHGVDRISFSTLNLGVFAVTVDRFRLRPFQGWRMNPIDEHKTSLVLKLSTGAEIKFLITNEGISAPDLLAGSERSQPQSCSLVLHNLERKGIFLKPLHRDERTYVAASELSEIAAAFDILRTTEAAPSGDWTGVRGVSVRANPYFDAWSEEGEGELVEVSFSDRHRVQCKVKDLPTQQVHASLRVALTSLAQKTPRAEGLKRALEKSELSASNVKFAEHCRQMLMQLGLLMDL